MVRRLIACLVVFAIAISGIAKPAYADPINSDYLAINSAVVNVQGSRNSIIINDSSNGNSDNGNSDNTLSSLSPLERIGEGFRDGALTTFGAAIGGVVICYTIDGIATMVFPPAGALSAFCPVIGGTASGIKAIASAA